MSVYTRHTGTNPPSYSHPQRRLSLRLASLLLALLLQPLTAGILYVNTAGNNSWTGTDPCCLAPDGPKATIQAAIDAAEPCDIVLVAPGNYSGEGNCELNFHGKPMTLRAANPLSHDTRLNGMAMYVTFFRFENGEGRDTIVEGFDMASAAPDDAIGSVYINNSSPTIRHCLIRDGFRQAVRIIGGSPLFEGCEITDHEYYDSYYPGGGLLSSGADPVIRDCKILRNERLPLVILDTSAAVVENCIIADNAHGFSLSGGGYAADNGGGIAITGTGTIRNCLVYGNVAFDSRGSFMPRYTDGYGGGIFCDGDINIINCTITDNIADYAGAGVYGGNLTNCIVRGNLCRYSGGNLPNDPCSKQVNFPNSTYCNIEGGYEGVGNIDLEPHFVDPCNHDYRLSRWSPCINAGDPCYVPIAGESDLDGSPRVEGGRIDMGAYEFGPMVFLRPSDMNDDAVVDMADLAVVSDCWLSEPGMAAWQFYCDINQDGIVNLAEFAALQRDWLTSW